MANMINLGAERVLYHVNFTAKKYDEKDAELFFAEVVAARQLRVDEPKRFCLRVCTMLDANNGKLYWIYKYSSSMMCVLA